MDKEYMETLKARDKAMPVKRYKWVTLPNRADDMICPTCGEAKNMTFILSSTWNFCPHCGQRIDQSNWAL